MSVPNAFRHLEEVLAESWPPESWREVTVIVAVSGGADSVALLRAVAAVRVPGAGRVVAVHFNHRLRGQASDGDEQFVRQLAAELKWSCEIGHWDASGREWSEEQARAARYDFLTDAARRLGARFVATAHTADDLAETVLHRILRGTGIGGLAGIPRCRELLPGVALIRPLLGLRRQDVLQYLEQQNQPFREDESNLDVRFTRNRIRRELLPLLEAQYNPQVCEALTRLAGLAAEAQQVIQTAAEAMMDRSVRFESDGRVVVACGDLKDAPSHLVREMLMAVWKRQAWPQQEMSFDKWEELAQLASGEDCKITLPGGIVAFKSDGLLSLLAPNGISGVW